jgi:murein DD-endopeptidase MepM/ murein hydrolase activator NlpD
MILIAGVFLFRQKNNSNLVNDQTISPVQSSSTASSAVFALPISAATSRITKKPFGIYVTPQNSPVSPERFTGYHTGVDFETTPAEANIDVPIFAICDGKLSLKESASGYGGVAVESCMLDGSPITVIYGHIKITSVTASVGDDLRKGEQIAVLGKGYSSETDGERKHLHLGIHKGTGVNILGYVQNKSQLANWLNFADYLK